MAKLGFSNIVAAIMAMTHLSDIEDMGAAPSTPRHFAGRVIGHRSQKKRRLLDRRSNRFCGRK